MSAAIEWSAQAAMCNLHIAHIGVIMGNSDEPEGFGDCCSHDASAPHPRYIAIFAELTHRTVPRGNTKIAQDRDGALLIASTNCRRI